MEPCGTYKAAKSETYASCGTLGLTCRAACVGVDVQEPEAARSSLALGSAHFGVNSTPALFVFPIGSLLHAFVDDERLRIGRALELRRPLLPLGVEADLQRVPADLVDAQHDRPLVRALGHRHIKGLR